MIVSIYIIHISIKGILKRKDWIYKLSLLIGVCYVISYLYLLIQPQEKESIIFGHTFIRATTLLSQALISILLLLREKIKI